MVLDSSEGRAKSIILFHLLTFAGYSFGDSFRWLLAIFLNLKTQLQKKKKDTITFLFDKSQGWQGPQKS